MIALVALLCVESADVHRVSAAAAPDEECASISPAPGLRWRESPRPRGHPNETFSISHCARTGSGGVTDGGRGAALSPGNELDDIVGDVVIRRLRDCDQRWRAATRRAKTRSVDADLVAASGPDEFSVTLTGPEHIVVPLEHLGACVYRFHYRVVLPGRYHLRVFLLSTGFDATVFGPATPPARLEDVLGARTFLELGSPADTATAARLHTEVLAGSRLPLCVPGEAVPGRWVSRSPPDAALLDAPVAIACAPGRCSRVWRVPTLTRASNLTWVPYHCSRRRFNATEKRACLADKRVLIHGESHARYFLRSLLASVVHRSAVVGVAYNAHEYRRTCARTGGTRGLICFSWDPFGLDLARALAPKPPQRRRPVASGALGRQRASKPTPLPLRRLGSLESPRRYRRRSPVRQPRRPGKPADAGVGGPPTQPWDIVSVHTGTWFAREHSLRDFNRTVRARLRAAADVAPPSTTVLWWTPQVGPVPGGCMAPGQPSCFAMRLPLLRGMARVVRDAVRGQLTLTNATRTGMLRLGELTGASEGALQFSADGGHIAAAPFQSLLVDELLSAVCPLPLATREPTLLHAVPRR